HSLLWRLGLYHGGIGISNLMYDMRMKKGMLNDWNISTYPAAKFLGRDRTASMPFMALGVLDEEGWNAQIRGLYRHDLESFVRVLLWICVSVLNGDEKRPG
ncbi:hypothetical protein C8J56DRAFT_739714, partial [Mycena floridula]